MAYLEIDKGRITRNLEHIKAVCKAWNIELTAVTKFAAGNPDILRIVREAGVFSIADSNMENFLRTFPEDGGEGGGHPLCKSLIKTRLSDIKRIPELPAWGRPDRVFVSDETLLDALCELPQKIRPRVVLITEIGDYKEGFLPEELPQIARQYSELPLEGLSANYACLSGEMPRRESIELLCGITDDLRRFWSEGKGLVSLGGTVAFSYLRSFRPPELVKEIRCGEGIFFGYDSSSGKKLEELAGDTFSLYGEILEIRKKNIRLSGEAGLNALGQENQNKEGEVVSAVLDFGILGAPAKDLTTLDEKSKIRGQTYDFTVVDFDPSAREYGTGGVLGFHAAYGAVSQAMLNPYIEKKLREAASKN